MTISNATNSLKPLSAMDRTGVAPSKAFRLPTAQSAEQPLAQQLRPVAQVLIAQTFYGNLLKQSENNPFKDDRLNGGDAGKRWNSVFNQHLAERMTRGAGSKLVNAVVKSITRKFDNHGKGAAA